MVALAAWLDWDETIHSLCNNWRFLARSAWTSVFHLFSGICLLFIQFLSFSFCKPSVGCFKKERWNFCEEEYSELYHFPKRAQLPWGFVGPPGHDGQYDPNIWTLPPPKLDSDASLLASAPVQPLPEWILHLCQLQRPLAHSSLLAMPWSCRICLDCEVEPYYTKSFCNIEHKFYDNFDKFNTNFENLHKCWVLARGHTLFGLQLLHWEGWRGFSDGFFNSSEYDHLILISEYLLWSKEYLLNMIIWSGYQNICFPGGCYDRGEKGANKGR